MIRTGVVLAANSPPSTGELLELLDATPQIRSSLKKCSSDPGNYVAISIKAWNAFRTDRPLQLLLWRNRGTAREALPTPM